MRPRRKARVFSSTPFLLDFSRGRGFRKIVFSKLRLSVRPSVQKPIALESVDFASPKVMGSRKRDIPLRSWFLPSNQSILFRKKGLRRKNRYLLSTCFLFAKFTSYISCCVTPTGANKLHRGKGGTCIEHMRAPTFPQK